jgi:ATP-dependent DNA helicase RecQ
MDDVTFQKRATELLRLATHHPTASFREGQEEAIRHIVEGRGRLLVVQKTGWGKSAVYFIAAKLLREQGAGPALLISPLLSLMRNQIAAAERMGVCAATINSSNKDDWEAVTADVLADTIDILLISPERLANQDFVNDVLSKIAGRVSLLVIDEAHCISDWGHDFRPDYRRIERILSFLPPNLRLLATTATANNRVMEDLRRILGESMEPSCGKLGRPSLLLQTLRLPGQAERLAWLATHLPQINDSGIVYTLTVRDAGQVAEWLKSRGIAAEPYTGQSENREELENALLENRLKCLVATTALGMGFDKPDLAFVVHYQSPASVVAYYQQVGRAGRAIASAHGALLSGVEEDDINGFFITNAFPSPNEVEAILAALGKSPDGLSVPEMLRQVNIRKGRIEHALKLLNLESPAPLVKDGPKWRLTPIPIQASFWERAERLTALRREEQQQMRDYVALNSGHMEFLIRALDGDPAGYAPPNIPPLTSDYDAALAQDAVAFLKRSWRPLELRKKGADSRNIAAEHRAEDGRILCVCGDAGWGTLAMNGKYRDEYFDDRLVSACVEMFRDWKPHPPPQWVTCIPSLRHPELVPGFAKRLAAALGLTFHDAFSKVAARPPQREMENNAQHVQNVDGAFSVNAPIPSAPVLLVDDMVDSRWTLTVAASLLRQSGSGAVYPLALASTSGGDAQ